MDSNFPILDMAGAQLEHSIVVANFVAAIRKQLMKAFGDKNPDAFCLRVISVF
ncbi:MAG: hypothetical protein HFH53_00885 [Hespellia sp.]|nr:hypothetical protein [Hespellia sp.]